MSAQAPEPPPLNVALKLSYGAGTTAYGIGAGILSASILQFYFNRAVGLSAVWVGFAIMVSLAADVLIDPLVGYWSDNLNTRWGRRHPFMYAAALPAAAFFYLLWHAPHGLDGAALLVFAVLALIGVRVSIAAYEIPSIALAPELAPDYDRRTSLLAYRWFFAIATIAVAQFILLDVYLRKDAANPLGMLNRDRYAEFGAVAAVVIFVSIIASTLATHRRIPYLHRPPARPGSLAQMVREIGSVFTNPSLLVLIGSSTLGGTGLGISTALQNYFYADLWGMSPQQIAFLVPGGLIASLLGIMLSPLISQRFGKKRAMLSLLAFSVFAGMVPIGGRLLGIMPPNGSPLIFWILFVDYIVTATVGMMGIVILTSMVADVVEDQQVRSGVRSEGVLFAANGLVPKFTVGLGAFIAGILLSLVHFPTKALPGTVDPNIVRHLALYWIPCSIVFSGGSVLALGLYRIDRSAHEHNVATIAEAAALAEEAHLVAGSPGPAPGQAA
jgi:Na+/melibiose symporter-like transporter